MSDMWSDDIGRCFCKKHRREICHKCCFDFTLINRRLELEAGIRQAPSQLETLTEQRVMLLNGIQFMRDNHRPSDDANLMFHVKELEKVEGKLAELKSTGTVEADEGETQSLHDAVEALTLSATQIHQNISDLRACGYCSKSNGVKLLLCSQCMKIAYCNSVCQKASWKDHKTFCKSHKVARDSSSDNHTDSNAEGNTDNKANDTVGDSVDGQEKTITKRSKLPLTWDQLEAYGGSVAQNKVKESYFLWLWILLHLITDSIFFE